MSESVQILPSWRLIPSQPHIQQPSFTHIDRCKLDALNRRAPFNSPISQFSKNALRTQTINMIKDLAGGKHQFAEKPISLGPFTLHVFAGMPKHPRKTIRWREKKT